ARVGDLPDPGRPGILLLQLGAGTRGRVLSRPGRGDRIRTVTGRLGHRPVGRPKSGPDRRGHRGTAGARPRRRKPCSPLPCGAHRRLLRTRRAAAPVVARIRRRAGRAHLPRRILRTPRRPQHGGDEMSGPDTSGDVTFAVLDIAPEPYAVTPILT